MDSSLKYLALIAGIPASGKSYFSHQLAAKLQPLVLKYKILSTDNLQAYLAHQKNFDIHFFKNFFSSHQWDLQLSQHKLNKGNFDEKIWNFSRKLAQDFEIMDTIFVNCDILIIQDELPLRSQRKPFKKYCSQKGIRFLQIELHTTLEEAIQSNEKRGEQNEKEKVSNQVIKKSFEKFEFNPEALVISRKTILKFLEQNNLLSNFKVVKIEDNYSEYLMKKDLVHEYGEKEMDENSLRKLISRIMKEENLAIEYFLEGIESKKKAQILTECKKIYIQQKRKIGFKQTLQSYMQKTQGK